MKRKVVPNNEAGLKKALTSTGKMATKQKSDYINNKQSQETEEVAIEMMKFKDESGELFIFNKLIIIELYYSPHDVDDKESQIYLRDADIRNHDVSSSSSSHIISLTLHL